MIQLFFKYDNEVIATVHNLSRLSNNAVWKLFTEAVTQQSKSKLIHEFNDIRDRLENENAIIIYNFDPVTQEFQPEYLANGELTRLIQDRLK